MPDIPRLDVQSAVEYDSAKKKKKDCTRYRQPLGWNSKTLCCVKEASFQRWSTISFHLYDIPRRQKKSDREQISG